MLFARGALSEIAVVRNINQQVRAAFDELPNLGRKGRFVADEDSHAVSIGRKNDDAGAGREIACFLCDAMHEAEETRHVLAKWNQVDLVVTILQIARGPKQHRGIQRRALRRFADRSKQEIRMRVACQASGFLAKREVLIVVDGAGNFRP